MRLLIALVLAWTITSLVLELVNRKGFKIKGTPAWFTTAVACLAIGLIVNALTSALTWTPFNVLAWTAIIFFGANAFFNLAIKPYFPTRKA